MTISSVGEAHTTGAAQTDVTIPACSVGDLIEYRYMSTNDTGALPTITYVTGGASAGFTLEKDTTNTRRCIVWWKFATSSDNSGSVSIRLSAVANTARIHCSVWHSTVGWVTPDASSDSQEQTSNASNPAQIATWTSYTGKALVTTGSAFNSGVTSFNFIYDNDAGITPQFTNSSSLQYGYKIYDGTTVIDVSMDHGTTLHAANAVFYKEGAPTVTGTASMSGGGTFAVTGVPNVQGTATVAGGGTFAASGVPTVIGVASMSGGGTFLAQQQGATVIQGVASLAGGGTFSATGTHLWVGTAVVSGGGIFHATGVRTTFGTAALAGGGSFSASGVIGTLAGGLDGEWAEGSATIPGGLTWTGVATFAGGGTFQAAGVVLAPGGGFAQLAGGGTFAAVGLVTVRGIAVLAGGGTFEATGASLGREMQRVRFRPRQRVIVRG